jgi:hypothetical protein
MVNHLQQALKAEHLFHRDVEYVVKDGEVIIVDEFTGRLMVGRRYSDGLHQAIEAKEKQHIREENQTLATITLQNYFRLYDKLAGMTGTAVTEDSEFREIYSLPVLVIPTNEPMIRDDMNDVIYKSIPAKFNALADEIAERHEMGQPCLVGTISIENSELVSRLLTKRGIPHEVLNAKHHEREAHIVAQAGRKGAITIATNMAGRGTDIMLGGNPEFMAEDILRERGIELEEATEEEHADALERAMEIAAAEHVEVVDAGGLAVIGTERHDSRRIDNQLRGRSGRQGDPGASQFYLSLEDDLLRLFGEDRMDRIVASAKAHGLRLIVALFADDPITAPLAVPWGAKRDPRADSYMIQRETALTQRVVSKLRSEQAVFAWELANEAFCARFDSAEELQAWVSALREAIREVDPDRPIVLPLDPETYQHATGIDATPALDECEILASHVTSPYRVYAAEGPITSGPATYLPSFLLRNASRDLPLLMDDIGVTSLEQSLLEEAVHLRGSLYSAVMNGAAGAMAKRYRDVVTERREPYFLDPYEVLVGVADSDGVPKRAMKEITSFVRTIGKLDLKRWSLLPPRAAVLVPSERGEPLPSLAGLYDPRSCLQAFVAAKEAHLPVDVIAEEERFGAYLTLIVPSAASLADETWMRLGEFVQGGGSIVVSYGGGEAQASMSELFGVEFRGDAGHRDVLSCRLAQPGVLGDLESFDASLAVPHFAHLAPGRGSVVATDATGGPLLTMHQYGQGKAVYVAAPLERAVAQGDPWAAPSAVKRFLRTVYGAVAAGAGAGASYRCDRPEVEIALFGGEDDAAMLLLNHAAEAVTANVTMDRAVATVADLGGGAAAEVGGTEFGVPLAPNGASALRLKYAAASESGD